MVPDADAELSAGTGDLPCWRVAPGLRWRRFGAETAVYVAARSETHLLDDRGGALLAALADDANSTAAALCANLGWSVDGEAVGELSDLLEMLASAGIVSCTPC